jgi:sugar O-acyltransferase (sialic acid O-acetyltransferase NeuD family)
METPIVIVGAGGFGREVLDVIEAVNAARPTWDFLGFLDDERPDETLLGQRRAQYLGPSTMLAELDARYVIGIGSGEARSRIAELASAAGRHAATLIHPSVTIGSDVEVGDGSILCAHASLTTHIRLGRHVHVNLNCTIGHDAVLEDLVTLFPGVSISGSVTLRRLVSVGTGAVVLPGLEVGPASTIGAGAAVVSSVAGGTTVVGVPARPVTKAH